jgi:hypothetical protein
MRNLKDKETDKQKAKTEQDYQKKYLELKAQFFPYRHFL